jgi:phage gp36-like protein
MPYAVKADLVPRRITNQEVIELTDDANSGASVDTIITDIILESSGMVDSYCRMRYITPLQASEQIKGLTLDIAEFLLFSRRRRMPETVKYNYESAIAFLQNVAAGKASLDQPSTAQPQVGGGPSVSTQKVSVFNEDRLKGYTG